LSTTSAGEIQAGAASFDPAPEAWGVSVCPRITGLAVADLGPSVSQEDALRRLGLEGNEFAEGIFARSGVRQRHLNLSDDFLRLTVQGRSAQVEDDLFAHAVAAVDQLDIDPQQISTVVSATLYSLGCPPLAQRLVEHYGMPRTTDKYHLVGVGCASAVPLMRLAAQSLLEQPRKQALVVAAESMSSILMPAGDDDPRAKIVGSAIFGDGCAAALLSRGEGRGPEILATQVHQLGDTLGAVSLALAPEDSYLHLARDLPELAAAGLAELVQDFLVQRGVAHEAIDHWIVHPGGRRIIESVRDALSLSQRDVATSWESLAHHGNIGTPAIFYVLKDTFEQRAPRSGDLGLAVTIGPGVTVGLMLLRW
jgi:alkylresorcinol/alkylpyrone synthase